MTEQQAQQLTPERQAQQAWHAYSMRVFGSVIDDIPPEDFIQGFLAARVAGCPDPGSREPWTGRRLFEFFEHEAERGRGWPRLIKLGKVHWENLAARIESEIAAAGCPDEGQREDARVSVGLARIGPHGPRTTGKVQTVEDAEIDAINAGYEVWIDRHELPDDFDAYLPVARAVIASLAASPALGAVAAFPDERQVDPVIPSSGAAESRGGRSTGPVCDARLQKGY